MAGESSISWQFARGVLVAALTLAACKAHPPSPATTLTAAESGPGPSPSTTATTTNLQAPPSPGDPASLAAVTKGDRDFAARIYARVRAGDGNVFFSPTSIRIALAMATMGARGETKAQMERVLGIDDAAAPGFAALLTQWSARAAAPPQSAANDWQRAEAERQRLVLRVANRLWGQRGKAFRQDFLAGLRDDFDAPLEQLDFHGAAEDSRRTVNTWVADRTEQRIKDLLPPGSVDSDTRLVLTNAVYFKAHWANEFSEAATAPGPFTTSSGATVTAPLMHDVDYYPHATIRAGSVPCAVLQLPYGAPGVSMIVLLPDARDGLQALEAQIDAKLIDAITAKLDTKRVDLTFPRFRTTSTFSLAEVLSAMGMGAAFVPGQADFSGMDDTRELFIGAVLHKAFVAVDEQGTEAAAATALAMAGAAAPRDPPIVFRADHPFVYVIADTTHRTILFMGRVVDPTG